MIVVESRGVCSSYPGLGARLMDKEGKRSTTAAWSMIRILGTGGRWHGIPKRSGMADI